MSKYSFEFKKKVVLAYLNGEGGYGYIAKSYGMTDYRNIRPIKDFEGPETLSGAKHLISAGCGEVGFIAGGDEIEIVGEKGKYTEEEIEAAYGKWCEYWRDYWRKRGTKAAYPKDFVCEASIPVSRE